MCDVLATASRDGGSTWPVQSLRATKVDSGIGSFIDSYFEYLWKSYLLFGHPDDVLMWTESYKALQQHLKRGPWYGASNFLALLVIEKESGRAFRRS